MHSLVPQSKHWWDVPPFVIGTLGGGVDISISPRKEFNNNQQHRHQSVNAVKKLVPVRPSEEAGANMDN